MWYVGKKWKQIQQGYLPHSLLGDGNGDDMEERCGQFAKPSHVTPHGVQWKCTSRAANLPTGGNWKKSIWAQREQ